MIVVSIAIAVLTSVNSCSVKKELNAYKNYYKATENLLDTLEKYYYWVDGHDPYDYYEAVEELNNFK